jgi:hypothetical protein
MIKSWRVKWMVYVARIGGIINAYKLWAKNLKGTELFETVGLDGRIILK